MILQFLHSMTFHLLIIKCFGLSVCLIRDFYTWTTIQFTRFIYLKYWVCMSFTLKLSTYFFSLFCWGAKQSIIPYTVPLDLLQRLDLLYCPVDKWDISIFSYERIQIAFVYIVRIFFVLIWINLFHERFQS